MPGGVHGGASKVHSVAFAHPDIGEAHANISSIELQKFIL